MNANRTAVEELIYDSCMHLDRSDYSGFMGLCHPHFHYKVTAYAPEIKREMAWLDHDREEMEDLFKTLPKHNSDHSPLTRNAVVYKVEFDSAGNQAKVISALQIFRTPLDGGATELFAVGKYYDTVSLAGERPELLSRQVALDTRDLGWGYHVPF
jgi:methanesulfonate monooxygenase small subunit